MSKKNSLLIVLLIIQLAFIGYAYRPGQNDVEPLPPFFSDVELEQVQGIQITDDQNSSISLSKVSENWLVKTGNYPGASDAIESLLRKIIALQPVRLVTKTKSSQVQLKIADSGFNRKIELRLADDSIKTFYLGSSPSNKSIHFRLAGENEVYIVKDLSTWELQTDKESWWRTEYVDINPADLSSFTISNAFGDFTLEKGKEGDWQNADQGESTPAIDQKAVSDLVGDIKKISISEYLGKEKPADLGDPVGKVKYVSKTGTQELEIWPTEEENGSHPVKETEQIFYAKVRAYTLKNILAAQLTDLITVPQEKSAAE
jgi:hypothetical protein